MNRPFFIVSSITYAMKSRDILMHHGINAYIERNRKLKEKYGCGYGIYVPKRTDEAQEILTSYGIRILARIERNDVR